MNLSSADALARLRLARTEGVGPQNYRRLLTRFGSAAAALEALPRLSRGASVPPPEAAVRREMEAVARLGGCFLFTGTPGYPAVLDFLEDSPPALAVLGDPAALAPPAVAIVGARNASAAGRRIAEELAEALARAGQTVVSGLARGIDTAAHLGALRARAHGTDTGARAHGTDTGARPHGEDARAGRTVAVVAGGLDQPYPPENAKLQARIAAEGGAVAAEAPLGTAPLARHFPRRNRIVAGLSLGVVVVEAALRSGSLITARLGLEAGREIFAVPGSPLDARCRGSNDLIRQGAHLVEGIEDILGHLPQAPREAPLFAPRLHQPMPEPALEPAGPPGEGSQLLELLGPTPIPVDEVVRRCHLSPSAVQAILLDLELAGRVEMLPGNRVALAGRP